MTAFPKAAAPRTRGFFDPAFVGLAAHVSADVDSAGTFSRSRIVKRRFWSELEDRCMREFYPHLRGADMAKVLKRSEKAVHQRAKLLGLHKSAEFLASDRNERAKRGQQNEAMKASRFKPGLIPWNKGVKGSAGLHVACRATQFKPGQMSGAAQRNYKPVGSLRVSKDGYLERKVTDDPSIYPARRWTAVARLVWEAAYGPIPRGHLVVFKPGLRTAVETEITLDRLECISRAENAQRNHPRTKSPELARLVQLKGAITRQVNRITREAEHRSNT